MDERGADAGAGTGPAADNTTMRTTRELCPESNNNNLIALGTKTVSPTGFGDGKREGPPDLGTFSEAAANRERGQSLMETILAQKMEQEGK